MKERIAILGLVFCLATAMTLFFTQPIQADPVPLPFAGPVNGFTGGIDTTTGFGDLTAVTSCQDGTCVPASPVTWVITSSLGWTLQNQNPTVTYSFQIPSVGFQTVVIRACNSVCFSQVRKIGWLDSEIDLFGLNNPVNPETAYPLWFTATTSVASPEYVSIYVQIAVEVNYSGISPMQMTLFGGTVESCESIPLGQTRIRFICQTVVSGNDIVTGYVLVPVGHGQVAFYTHWDIGHNYFQPAFEAEYPWDSHNVAASRYGSSIYVPLMIRS